MPSATASSSLPLDGQEIHLWLLQDRKIDVSSLLQHYQLWLSPEERQQQTRFHFARDRHQYLLTRALVRSTLSRYLPLAPTDWKFDREAHGRPRLLNPEARAAGLVFNISHSPGLIALGITCNRQLGIDCENFTERPALLDIAQRYFSPQETAALQALPEHQQRQRFFHYWTLKEAYVKARSLGLNIPLDQFSFSFPDKQQLQLEMASSLLDSAQNWHCRLIEIAPDHALALVCSRKPAPPVIRSFLGAPLLNWQRLEPPNHWRTPD